MAKIKVKKITDTKKKQSNVLELKARKPKEIVTKTAEVPPVVEIQSEELVKNIETKTSGALETRYFTPSFLTTKLEQVLTAEETIQKINSIEIRGDKNKLLVAVNLEAKIKGVGIKGLIQMVIENKEKTVEVNKKIEIKANLINKILIKLLLQPRLNEISQKLKEHIEDEKLEDGNNYEVDTIQIKSGQLEVVFKK